MHYEIQRELARAHQADLLREADRHRLAAAARGSSMRRGRFLSILIQARQGRLHRRPAPAF
jgi:hypothetical protein